MTRSADSATDDTRAHLFERGSPRRSAPRTMNAILVFVGTSSLAGLTKDRLRLLLQVPLDLRSDLVAGRHPLLARERFQPGEVLLGVLVLLDRRIQSLALGEGVVAQRPQWDRDAETPLQVLEEGERGGGVRRGPPGVGGLRVVAAP